MDEITLRSNIERVQERIAAAEQRVGRTGQVALIAVSKTHPAETVAQAYCAGLRVFGENRVEEAGPKAEAVRALLSATFGSEISIEWHMIGHLQSRKAADVLPWASLVHSVDTVKLAGRLSRAAPKGRVLPVLLEVNVSGEQTKAGFRPEELAAAVGTMAALPSLRIEGLMTMAPIVEDPEQARPVFRVLRKLRDQLARHNPALPWTHLSMGMTDDFEVAIEEGATLVRIGRAIFGER
ncbi:MAG: YggS family pyridoxal phosphate-dependent enzyme [Nitrososphaerales archaeon]